MGKSRIRDGSIEEMLGKVILLDIETVADNLKVDISQIIAAIKSGKIPFIKIFNEEKISIFHLYRYIEQHTHQYDELKQELKNIMKGEKDGTE